MNPVGGLLLLLLLERLKGKPSTRLPIHPKLALKVRQDTEEKVPVIVYYKGCPFSHMVKYLHSNAGARVKYHLPIINACAVEIPARHVKRLAAMNEIDYICEDFKVFIHMDIARNTIKIPQPVESRYTGKGIGVAVIDTGVHPHPDLTKPKNRIVAFKDFINNKRQPYDDNGHGTHVAGCIAGNGYLSNGKYAGIAPDAHIVAVKALDQDGGGNASDVIAAIQWVVDNKEKYNIKVLNLSMGTTPDSSYSPLDEAVMAAWKKGITVVAAAGNSGPKKYTITSPGICPDVITVGALDDRDTPSTGDDRIADFSSRGPTKKCIIKPDIVAPGVNIVSLAVPSEEAEEKEYYKSLSGTSMATPIVSGCAALIHQASPDYTNKDVKSLLMSTADRLRYPAYVQGKGLVNMKKIFSVLQGGEQNK